MCSVQRIAIFILMSLLYGCGGGSSSSKDTSHEVLPPPPPTYNISGGGIKGPLINATVKVSIFDPNSINGIGDLVATGSTNDLTEITGVELTGTLEQYYVLSIEANENTVDISTQSSPIIKSFKTIMNLCSSVDCIPI